MTASKSALTFIAPHLTRQETDFMAITAPVTLESLTADLIDCVAAKRRLSDDLAYFGEREATLRSDIHALMQQDGIKTADTPYARVQRKQGQRVTVTDREQLEAALTEAGLLESVQKTTVALDLTAAKKLALKHEMPGVERVEYDELAITLVEVQS